MNKLKENKNEIIWNIINSVLAAGLVVCGSLVDGGITKEGLMAAVVAGSAVALTKLQQYWNKEEKEYCKGVFNFI